jgi:hypothetical protein
MMHQVFNGGNNHAICSKSGCQAGIDNISEMGADNRLVGQIHPNEFYAMVDWRRFDCQIDFLG